MYRVDRGDHFGILSKFPLQSYKSECIVLYRWFAIFLSLHAGFGPQESIEGIIFFRFSYFPETPSSKKDLEEHG